MEQLTNGFILNAYNYFIQFFFILLNKCKISNTVFCLKKKEHFVGFVEISNGCIFDFTELFVCEAMI